MLIELLKSDDPEFKIKEDLPRGSLSEFSRDKVILTLGAIGPPANGFQGVGWDKLASSAGPPSKPTAESGGPARRSAAGPTLQRFFKGLLSVRGRRSVEELIAVLSEDLWA